MCWLIVLPEFCLRVGFRCHNLHDLFVDCKAWCRQTTRSPSTNCFTVSGFCRFQDLLPSVLGLPTAQELPRKRPRDPSDDLLLMDMKSVGSFYYENFVSSASHTLLSKVSAKPFAYRVVGTGFGNNQS
ncbi:hypothetical protein J6590_023408 [Homalodisca vitripennis]|nr:hypothetical protein J6590_023408 [Homalodisca vitripennis]